MSSLFVSDELIPISVKYIEVKNKLDMPVIKVVKDKDTEQRYNGSVKELITHWTVPNWKQSNDMLRSSTRWDVEAGERVFDWSTYRGLVLDSCMKSWEIEDEGKAIPCTKENIAKLDPNIAAALVDGFLARTTLTEKDLGE